MEDKVFATIQKYGLIECGDRLVIGVSGGPDSMCLLAVLQEIQKSKKDELDFTMVVAHLNHMLRIEANEEEAYVKNYCQEHGIVCFVKQQKVDQLAKQEKVGTELAGRKVRYDFFEEVLKQTKSNKIVTAHQRNDKIETMLMNMLRGSGPSGLKGIEAIREGKFIRPLIEIQRREIEQYCEEKQLHPKQDSSNEENIYTRNKVRNELIPYLEKEYNPNLVETLNRLSEIIVEEQNYLKKMVHTIYKELVIGETKKEITLDLKTFNQQEKVIQRRLILYTVTRLFGSSQNIEKIHIEDIIQLCYKNIGNKYLLPNKNLKVLVKNHKIFFQSKA